MDARRLSVLELRHNLFSNHFLVVQNWLKIDGLCVCNFLFTSVWRRLNIALDLDQVDHFGKW